MHEREGKENEGKKKQGNERKGRKGNERRRERKRWKARKPKETGIICKQPNHRKLCPRLISSTSLSLRKCSWIILSVELSMSDPTMDMYKKPSQNQMIIREVIAWKPIKQSDFSNLHKICVNMHGLYWLSNLPWVVLQCTCTENFVGIGWHQGKLSHGNKKPDRRTNRKTNGN